MLQINVAPNLAKNCQVISGLQFWVQGSIQPAMASDF